MPEGRLRWKIVKVMKSLGTLELLRRDGEFKIYTQGWGRGRQRERDREREE